METQAAGGGDGSTAYCLTYSSTGYILFKNGNIVQNFGFTAGTYDDDNITFVYGGSHAGTMTTKVACKYGYSNELNDATANTQLFNVSTGLASRCTYGVYIPS